MMDQSTMGQQFPKSQSTKSDTIYRADAIKAIEDMQDCYNGFSGTYDKAQIIGVLEDVPTAELPDICVGDTISRQAALDLIRNSQPEIYISDYKMPLIDKAYIQTELTLLPTAEPQWIPCSIRMPEKEVTVWLTIAGHDVIICKDGETLEDAIDRISKTRWVTQGFLAEDGWYGVDGYPMLVRPIAWMPLKKPKAYEGE